MPQAHINALVNKESHQARANKSCLASSSAWSAQVAGNCGKPLQEILQRISAFEIVEQGLERSPVFRGKLACHA